VIQELRDLLNGKTELQGLKDGLWANGSLVRAVRLLEAWKAGIDIEQFRTEVEVFIAGIKVAPGIYKRSKHNPMQSSHDEFMALLILDALYKLGITAELLEHKGLWITGKAHDTFLGFEVDSEWLTTLRPAYRAYAKFVIGKESWCDRILVHLNLRYSTTWNLLRARLLLLEFLNVGGLEKYHRRLGDKYKGRYGDEPIINYFWKVQYGTGS